MLKQAEEYNQRFFRADGGEVAYAGIDDDPTTLLLFLMEEGVDPNVHRKRLLSCWVKANSQGLNTNK